MERSENILKGIFDKFSTLNIHENRKLTDEYCELVFLNKEIGEWEKIFTEILGSAVKPSKANPSEGDLSITKQFGGICANQTLFKKDYGNTTIIAMFWPWQDSTYTTLKIVLMKNDQ